MKKFLIAAVVLGLVLLGVIAGCQEAMTSSNPMRSMYAANCAACHQLIPESEYDLDKAYKYVHEYGRGLDPEQKQQLIDYLAAGGQ